MFVFRQIAVIAVLLSLITSAAQAVCMNGAKPGGYVWDTTNPYVYLVYPYDPDSWVLDNWVRLFFHAGKHSRSTYVKGDGAIAFPAGTTDIFAVNIDSCGNRVGTTTDTWLKTVSIPN